MRFRDSLAVLTLALVAMVAPAQKTPRPAGEFAIGLNNGGQILLSQYSGKVVVLAFMFTTCPHCQHTSQILSQIQREYADQGLQILGAFFNPNAADLVPGFITQFQPAFPVGFAERDQVNEYLQHSPGKPTYVPELIFIDRNRQIRAQYSGDVDFFKDQDKNIRAVVESLLKEPVSAKKNGHSAPKKQS
jgi:thiol-disulfide isomerase/thioredoxin